MITLSKIKYFLIPIIIFICIEITCINSALSKNLTLIRDAEIENTINGYMAPLLKAAKLPINSVKIHIVKDPRLNAFVYGGLNIFLNTGLITQTDSIGEIVGVLAHEIGHIEGGHLMRAREAIKKENKKLMMSQIAGALAMIAGRNSKSIENAPTAILIGGQASARDGFLRYNRSQEQAADQAALRYLDATKQSAKGLMHILKRLENQEKLSFDKQDPYTRSHPLTRDRKSHVANHLKISDHSNSAYNEEIENEYLRMVSKLKAFITPIDQLRNSLNIINNSFSSKYARAIAHYRLSEVKQAILILNDLLRDYPDDPWLHELHGQILFESGQIFKSINSYTQAVSLAPRESLLRLGLARAQIETGKVIYLKDAVKNLKLATNLESNYAPHWHFLGVALGRIEKYALADLAFAEASVLRGSLDKAMHHAIRAEKLLPPHLPSAQRARDITNLIRNTKD